MEKLFLVIYIKNIFNIVDVNNVIDIDIEHYLKDI